MKLVMTMLVRNEQDILRENLEAHLAHGVDFFLVMDHQSDDGTAAILRDYSARGLAEVFTQPDPGYYQSRWVTAMARRAASTWGADWVINSDADEFWWPATGTLKTALQSLGGGIDVAFVQRRNFRPTAETDGHFLERMVYRDVLSTNNLGEPLSDKACHRGHPRVRIPQGNHDADAPGFRAKRRTAAIEILHFPVRSLEQFENKIALGGAAYEAAPDIDPRTGNTWRKLYRDLKANGLRDYFERQCAPAIAPGVSDPSAVLDTRLRDFMRARLGTSYAAVGLTEAARSRQRA